MKTALLLSVLCAAMAVAASQSCGSETCASDEFCDTTTNTCQCNSTLYTYTGGYPSPNVTCTGGDFNILVSKCWLESNNFNSSDITLQNSSCLAQREVVNGLAEMGIQRPLVTNDCGTTATANNSYVTYSNVLYIYSKTFPVQSRPNVAINISCTIPLTINNIALNFTLNPITGTTVISAPGSSATFTVNMVAYTDDQYSVPLTASDTLIVGQYLYIAVSIPGLDATAFSVEVLNIYATGDAAGAVQYNLLTNGCPAAGVTAGLLSVTDNGNGTEARFRMKVFQITGSVRIQLTSDLKICANTCVPTCTSTRSAVSQNSEATVSIIFEPFNKILLASSASSFSMSQTLPALFFSWILVKLI